MTQVCRYAILVSLQKDGNLLPLLLQVIFGKSDHLQLSSISHFRSFNVVTCRQRHSRDNGPWPLHSRKKTGRLNELAKHRNQICKTRCIEKSASLKFAQLAPRSFCHAVDGIMSHLWRFRDTKLQRFRSRKTSPAAWLGSSLKRSTNWWKAISENCTRTL